MSRVETFIQEHTKNCSNEIERNEDVLSYLDYVPWLTPDQARKAVEIAREETIKEVCEWIENNVAGYCVINDTYDVDGCIDDLKKHLKGKL